MDWWHWGSWYCGRFLGLFHAADRCWPGSLKKISDDLYQYLRYSGTEKQRRPQRTPFYVWLSTDSGMIEWLMTRRISGSCHWSSHMVCKRGASTSRVTKTCLLKKKKVSFPVFLFLFVLVYVSIFTFHSSVIWDFLNWNSPNNWNLAHVSAG